MPAPTISNLNPIDAQVSGDGLAVLAGPAFAAIVAERVKQVDRHGYTLARDQLTAERLDFPSAAVSYTNIALDQLAGVKTYTQAGQVEPTWPWHPDSWRPDADPRANLVKAAALIWAAIDYLDNKPAADVAQAAAA